MKINNILLDLDGVMSDFCSAVIKEFNIITEKEYTLNDYVKCGHFEMEKFFDVSIGAFWEILEFNENFWLDLKPFPWAKELLNRLQKIANVTICSSPSQNPICAMHKTQWIKEHLGLSNSSLMLGKRKYLMAKEGNVLIDDYSVNVEKFEKNGGKGILVPSNWNTYDLTLDKVWAKIEQELTQ